MDVRAVLKEILTVEVRIEEKIVEKRVVNDGSAARKGKAAGISEADQEQIAEELGDLMEQLKGMGDKEALDQEAGLAAFTPKTTIIEQIINLREPVHKSKPSANFNTKRSSKGKSVT